MKKNAMLKIAAILLVAVLLTTCAISTTFAKYVTEAGDAGELTARVAAWGVDIASTFESSNGLFAGTYPIEGTSSFSVKANEAVVAPGTSNKIEVSTVVTGTPEVSGKVIIKVDVELGDNWKVNNGTQDITYCPLMFRVSKTGTAPTGAWTTCTGNPDDFETAIETLINGAPADSEDLGAGYEIAFAPGDLATLDSNLIIEWAWDFHVDETKDDYDTQLANKDTLPSISLTFNVSAEQTGPSVGSTNAYT